MIRALALLVLVAGCRDSHRSSARDEQRVRDHRTAPATPPASAPAGLEAEVHARARAAEQAREARTRLAQAEQLLADFDAQLAKAVSAVADAANDAQRGAAAKRLDDLKGTRATVQKEVEAQRAAIRELEQRAGIGVSPECAANPLAKGC